MDEPPVDDPGRAAGPQGRLPLVPEDTDDPILREIFDFYRARGRRISVLYRALGNAPAVLRGWSSLGFPLRHEASADRAVRELMIMRIGQLTRSEFEWQAHWPMALEAGITEEQLADLSRWQTSARFSDDERAILALAEELTVTGDVGDDTFAEVAARFPPGEIVEIVVTAAFYSCVSRVVKALRIPRLAEDGMGIDVYRDAVTD